MINQHFYVYNYFGTSCLILKNAFNCKVVIFMNYNKNTFKSAIFVVLKECIELQGCYCYDIIINEILLNQQYFVIFGEQVEFVILNKTMNYYYY